MKNYLCLIIFVISISNVFSQEIINFNDSNKFNGLNDGPYIFIERNNLVEKEIINGKISTKELDIKAYDTLFSQDKVVYKKIKYIAALSDIHGEYDLAIELLKNNKIIDENLNWNFDQGHLVIVGDIFDRGDKVNELLFLVFKLEQQAKNKGGRVHFLLGNHEYMVLKNDLRYINYKYKLTSELMELNYDELYSNKTVIGRWLRSKPTIIKINNNIFVHGGISKDFLSHQDFDIERINQLMRNSIDTSKTELKSSDFYNIYYGSNSLIWYRGYFYDNLKDSDISEILNHVNSRHLVVGHCMNKEVVSLFNNKIFGVDSGIQKGEYGELLFINKRKYYRGTLEGKKIKFKKRPNIIQVN